MNQLLHVSAASVKETEDGNLCTITLGAVSANAAELIPLVGEQVVLRTPGQRGRTFGGSLTALLVKDGKHGPEVTLKVIGATELNALVGTNVEIEAAQMELPVGAVAPKSAVQAPHEIYQQSVVQPLVEKVRKENADLSEKERLKSLAADDLENF